MTGRTMEFGIRITADGRVAVTEAGKTTAALDGIGKSAQAVEKHTSALTASLVRLGQVAAGALSVREIAQATDAWANMNSRIALSSASLAEASKAMDGVYRIAQKAGGDLAGIADIYQKIARNAVQYGLDQAAALGVTEAIANAVRLSGASAAAASGALLQFGQALSAGQLRGEELNSVLEQTPALAEAIARGMGKTTGELRKLGEEGQLAAGDVLSAIRREAGRLENEVGAMAPTIETAMQRLQNAFTKQMGEEASGAARLVASGIDTLAGSLDKATQAVAIMGAAYGAIKIVGWVDPLIAASAASAQHTAALRAEAAALIERARAGVATNAEKVLELQATLASTAAARGAAVAQLGEANATLAAAGAVGAYSYAQRLAAESTVARSAAVAELAALGRLQAGVEAQLTAATTAHTAAQNALTAATARHTAVVAGGGALAGLVGWVSRLNPLMVAATAAVAAGAVAYGDWAMSAQIHVGNVAKDIESLASGIARTNAQISTMSRAAAEAALADARRARAVDVAQVEKLKARYEKDFGGDQRQTSRDAIAERDALRVQIMQAEGALARLDAEMASMTSQLGQAGVKAVNEFYDTFGSKTTKTAAEVAKLNKAWEKAATALVAQGDTAGLLKLADEYQAKLAELQKVGAGRTAQIKEQYDHEAAFSKQIIKALAEEDAAKMKQADVYAAAERAMIAPLEERAARLEAEVATYGMTEGAIQRVAIARLEEARTLAAANGAWPEHLAFLDREIAARKRLAAADDGKVALDADKKAVEEMQRNREQMWGQIGQSLTDEIMRGGKSAGELLQNYFRTLVLRPVIQGAVNIGMNAVGNALGIGNNAVAGGANLLSTGSSLYSASTGGGLYGSFATSSIGQSLGLSSTSLGAATSAEAFLAGAPNIAPGLTTLGTAIPYIGAALAIGSALGLFGGKEKDPELAIRTAMRGTKSEYDNAIASGQYNAVESPFGIMIAQAQHTDDRQGIQQKITDQYLKPIADLDRLIAAKLDKTELKEIQLALASWSTGESKSTGKFDGKLKSRLSIISDEIGGYVDGIYDAFATNLKDGYTILAAALAVDGDAGYETLLKQLMMGVEPLAKAWASDSESTAQAAARMVANLQAVNATFDNLGLTLFDVAAMGVKAASDLVDVFGGLDNFSAGMAAYYTEFYSEQEKLDLLTGQLTESFGDLGYALPETRDEFRALVEGLDLTTETGRDTFASFIGLAGGLDVLLDAAESAGSGIVDTAEQISAAALKSRQSWQDQLDMLTGVATQRSIALRDEPDSVTRDLMGQVWSEQDRQALASTNLNWQQMLDVASGVKTDRQVELENALTGAGDDSTKALIKQYYAQLDLNDAAEIARQEAERAAEAAQRAAEEQARAAQQAAEEQARAAQQAADEQARAAERIRTEWQRTADSIYDTMRDLRGDLLGETAQGLAAYEAQFSIATAAARAGDRTAADNLPELARAIVELGTEVAASRLEADSLTARTYNSLEATMQALKPYGITIPGFAAGGFHAGGLRLVGETGMEIEATGPARYWSASQTSDMLAGNGLSPMMRSLIAEVAALRAEVVGLRGESKSATTYAKRTSDVLEMVTEKGFALRTKAVA